MNGHAVGQVDSALAGIHLMWSGSAGWPWAPDGWTIQRRPWKPAKDDLVCETVGGTDLDLLRFTMMTTLDAGVLTLGPSWAPASLVAPPPSLGGLSSRTSVPKPWEVFRLRLAPPVRALRLHVTCSAHLACALQAGKVVAVHAGGDEELWFETGAIDEVVIHATEVTALEFCRFMPGAKDEENDWATRGVTLVEHLRLPIREADASLRDLNDELTVARKRLLRGETLDQDEFVRAMSPVRAIVEKAGRDGAAAAPGDLTLLMASPGDARPQELRALAAFQALAVHPRWRRILGLAWFDDVGLTHGDVYEYRVLGALPRRDVEGRRAGFHTVPSGTSLPEHFYLGDVDVLLARPAAVTLAEGISGERLTVVTRRGIRLDTPDPLASWLSLAVLAGWDAVVDLPAAVAAIDVELDGEPEMEAAITDDPATPLRSLGLLGPEARVRIEGPVRRLALRGRGLLTGLRICPTDDVGDTALVVANIPAIVFEDAPRPAPPLLVTLSNLQRPSEAPPTDVPGPIPARHALGFDVGWRPAVAGGLTVWPPVSTLAPPLDAFAHQIEHREGTDAATLGSWQAILGGDNQVFASRGFAPPDTAPLHAADLMALFPEAPPPPFGLDMSWRDVFDLMVDPERAEPARIAHTGTFHQYRIRGVDAVGRPGTSWTESPTLRLEKRYPPPLPPGPTRPPAEGVARPPGPSGVRARLLISGDDTLSDDDRDVLGTSSDAIVVEWGWSDEQRGLDPGTNEFRVYSGPRRDLVGAWLTSSAPLGGGIHDVVLDLEQAVRADAAVGTFLHSGGYAFHIDAHQAGTTGVHATVSARVARTPPAVPAPGPTRLRLHYTPDMTRPPGWTREAVVAVTADEPGATDDWARYRVVLREVLRLTPTTPLKTVWVGVSAADAESYVPDQLPGLTPRAGNESAISAVAVSGRYRLRPTLVPPIDLAEVPRLATPEPADRPVAVTLDLVPHLPTGVLAAGELVRAERADGDAVAGAFRIDGANLVARVVEPAGPSDTETVMSLPPLVAAALTASLASGAPLPDRYVVYLAAVHPMRDRLFTTVTQSPVPLGPFSDALPPQAARWIYRFRRAHPSGVVSVEGLVARVVVRVPSLAPGATPEGLARTASEQLHGLLRLRVPADGQVTHLLVFAQVGSGDAAMTVRATAAAGAEPALLRVPNPPPGMAPEQRIKLRIGSGLLVPYAKAIGDPEVTAETPDDGAPKVVSVAVVPALAGAGGSHWRLDGLIAQPTERVRVWACTLSADGVPSRLAGPFAVGVPIPPGGP